MHTDSSHSLSSSLPLTESTKEVAKVEKAVLSTTAKAKERQKKKDAEKQSKSGGTADKSGGLAQPHAKQAVPFFWGSGNKLCSTWNQGQIRAAPSLL